MISQFLPMQSADAVALDFGVFVAEQARTHHVSQTAIIAALRPHIAPEEINPSACNSGRLSPNTPQKEITPSQSEGSSSPHAPAAVTTDGEGLSSSRPSSPSVEPIPETSDAGAHGGLNDLPSAAVESVPLTTDSPANEGDESDVAPETAQRTMEPDAANGGGQRADAVALGSAVETGALPSKRHTKRQQVIDCHKANPDWNSFQIAEHLGFGAAHVQVIAGQCGIKLPRAPRTPPENMRDKVIAVAAAHPDWTLRQIASEAGCSLGTASKWAKDAQAKPPEAEAPSAEPQVQPAPELPPVSKPSERLRPLVENDVTDVLHRPRKAQSGRFYLREKAVIGQPPRWVHQSLSPCPTGPGPLMTLDRKWAWFDTMDRYRGALKQWPQITSMIKESVQ